jgi:hypothetical protein
MIVEALSCEMILVIPKSFRIGRIKNLINEIPKMLENERSKNNLDEELNLKKYSAIAKIVSRDIPPPRLIKNPL